MQLLTGFKWLSYQGLFSEELGCMVLNGRMVYLGYIVTHAEMVCQLSMIKKQVLMTCFKILLQDMAVGTKKKRKNQSQDLLNMRQEC